MHRHGGDNRRLAVDKIEHVGYANLIQQGVDVLEGQMLTEHARSIKNENEVRAMRCAIHACEMAVDEMRQAMRPGVSENEMWAALHAGNIKRGGEWIETRILSSGPRTNPWFQECGPRIMQEGDMMAFDTDLVGTYGYCCDISRSWIVGDATPTDEQRALYCVAHDHVMTNIDLIQPGMSFAEMTAKAHRLPEAYRAQRYGVIAHGVGLCDEYPCVRYPEDVEAHGYEGSFAPGMTLCVEAYVGAVGGHEGVKLEEQVLVTETGCEVLSRYPYEDALLA
jgi:Xaa-Pro aminopeptidase